MGTRRVTPSLSRLRGQVTNERGTMLLVALMVLLALTAVGMTSVQLVNEEINFAGNTRRGATTFRVTESGLFTALAFTSELGAAAFSGRVDDGAQLQSDGTSTMTTWAPDAMIADTEYFDMTESGSFGYEGVVLADEAEVGTQPADFEVRITETGMRQPLVGYSFSGPGARCRFKYQLDAVGNVGNQFDDEPEDASTTVWQMLRSNIYVGPLPCDLASSSIGSI